MNVSTHFVIFAFSIGLFSCLDQQGKDVSADKNDVVQAHFINEPLSELTELQAGDILVKPNHNWLPGSSLIEGGNGFGHAVLVIEGAQGNSAIDVLRKARIFESQAHQLPDAFQLRAAPGYLQGNDYRFANVNFGEQNAGFRYRLRIPMTDGQRDSIIRFVMQQDNDISCWRSQKLFRAAGTDQKSFCQQASNKHQWYCSLLVWQAFYTIMHIDLDSNGGWMVYPGDLVAHPIFDNQNEEKRRIRF